jgi:hypothetical protein
MQNKPNSPNVQMNVTFFTTMNYTIFVSLTEVKNKPNSNPIQTQLSQLKPISMPIKAKTNPIQTQSVFFLPYSGWNCVNQADKAADDIWWIELIIDSYKYNC